MLDSVTADLRIVMNGKTVLDIDMEADISLLYDKLSIMGKLRPNGYIYSLFGRMTGVTIFSKLFSYYRHCDL